MAVTEATIIENTRIAKGIWRMRLTGAPQGKPGQFVMLRIPGALDPFLGRPISLNDSEGDELTLLYQVVGHGPAVFSTLRPGQAMDVQGSYGNGFPLIPGDAVVIGGGIGTAPLYLLVKRLREEDPKRRIDVYLGFREEAYGVDDFKTYADNVHVNIGGFVTKDVDFSRNATYYACGPSPMLRAA
ncbi:MAG: dihydroorotate dehydrogenase electron transfer subunit, partial [Bacillota bacterium]